MAKIVAVEGIGASYAQKLKEAGIATTRTLLAKGSSPVGRKEIAKKTGVDPKLILRWVNQVDLIRIKGVGEEYAELLEAAGVDTVPELAQRNPASLHQKMIEVNDKKKLVRRPPSEEQVENWITQAKRLPRVVTY